MLTFEDDHFTMKFSIDRYSAIKDGQTGIRGDWEKRMHDRKKCEEMALEILLKPLTQLKPEDMFRGDETNLNKMGALNLLDIDAILLDGTIKKTRFGQLIPANSKFLFDGQFSSNKFNTGNFKIFKEAFDILILTDQHITEIEKNFNKLIEIKGVRAFMPSLILYLKDGLKYNIMTKSFADKLLKKSNIYRDDFTFYQKYNDFINKFKNEFSLNPQEIDCILSSYNNSKWDKFTKKLISQNNNKNEHKKIKETITTAPFNNYSSLIEDIKILTSDRSHKERAHESLVESFFINLGYVKHKDIQYRKGRIDISIVQENKPIIIIEVKREWNLKAKNKIKELKQAYNYALETGTRYIIITNGDYYLFIDRLKGLSYKENIVGEFQLTNLKTDNYTIIQKLKKENIFKFDFEEIFQNLSLCFK